MAFESGILDDFSGGLDLAAPFGKAQSKDLRNCLSMAPDVFGGLRFSGGYANAFTSSRSAQVLSFIRFDNGTVKKIVYSKLDAPNTVHIFTYDETTHVHTQLNNFVASGRPQFEQFSDKLYITTLSGIPQVWDGVSAGTAPVGLAAGTILTVTPSGAGVLDDSPTGNRYRWYYTYYNSTRNLESNPSPPSIPLDLVNQKVDLTGFFAVSYATHYRIYRDGGNNVLPVMVAQVAASTTTYTDNTADEDLGSIPMPVTHGLPPSGITHLIKHKNRLFAIANIKEPGQVFTEPVASRVWYSELNHPEYWSATDTGLGSQAGFVDIDNDNANPNLKLDSTGSILVIGRAKSVHTLLGDKFENFVFHKQSEIGLAASESMVRSDNVVTWLGTDGLVYNLGDKQASPIAIKIENILKTVSDTSLASACAAFWQQKYILCIPVASSTPYVLVYDFRNQAWSENSSLLFNATFMRAYQAPSGIGKPELLFAAATGYIDVNGSSYNGIVRAFTPTTAVSIPVYVKTVELDFKYAYRRKRAAYIRVEGTITQGGGDAALVLTLYALQEANGAVVTKNQVFNLTGVSNILLNERVAADIVGQYMWVVISGNVRDFELRNIEIGYSYLDMVRK